MDLAGRSFDRILLIKPSSLGDVIHALPVLRGLRRRYPQARIDWLIGTPFAPLLQGHPDLTEVVLFDRRRFGRMAFSPRAASEFVGFMGDLRARRYDLAIDLQGLFRSGFLTRATGAPIRLGFQNAREGARMFYTHRIETPPGDIHAVDKNYLVAQVLGSANTPVEFHLPVAAEARSEAERLVGGNVKTPKRQNVEAPQSEEARKRGSDTGEALQITNCELGGCVPADAISTVVIAPGARWETKRWLPERFAATVDRLRGQEAVLPMRFVLLGGREDQELCAEIARRCAQPVVDLAGRTSLPVLAALIEAADVVLCHDSGVAHIAAALKRPLVCITGPTNHRRTGPYRREQDVLRLDLECSPCYLRRLPQCPHQHRCMGDLQVEQVVAAVLGNVKTSKHQNVKTSLSADLRPNVRTTAV